MSNSFELSVASNDAFREIFQSMTEGIVVVNREGTILIANPIAENMFGYKKNELMGRPLEELLPERYRRTHTMFRSQFNEKPSPRRMGMGRDLAAIRRDGSEFPVEISLSFSMARGEFIAIAFITDITLRKKAEEVLRQGEEQLITYAAELEKKVEARTEDLNMTIRKLETEVAERKRAEDEVRKSLERERELNELKTKFVSIASHEFRTPLSTILSSISLVEQYGRKADWGKMEKHTLRVRSSVNHLTGILNDFLSLGKLEEGKVDVKLETIDLTALLEDIREEIQGVLKDGQEILVTFTGNKSLTSDSRILRNVLFNLLSNASKYSEEGKKIHVLTQSTNGAMSISIRDEGIGIPAGDQKHMFERFFRASNAGNIPGTGLGLNIVKRYVSLLNGNISFITESSVGSTFTVNIPNQL